MKAIQNAAYLASAELARREGCLPAVRRPSASLRAPTSRRWTSPCARRSRRHGMRNGCLTSIAPTGTISLLAGNVSSGIEPVFDFVLPPPRAGPRRRNARGGGRGLRARALPPPVRSGSAPARQPSSRPPIFRHASISRCRRPCSAHVDSAISKTINCPEDISFADFKDVYLEAHALGLKGCTTYRPNPVTGSVLSSHD